MVRKCTQNFGVETIMEDNTWKKIVGGINLPQDRVQLLATVNTVMNNQAL